ncbi:MAG: hypothetical protein ABJ311_04275 [Erythrobacter sp.]
MAKSPAFVANGPGDGSQITMLVDSGGPGHLLEPFPILVWVGWFNTTAPSPFLSNSPRPRQYVLEGIATGNVRGHVTDVTGAKRLVTFPAIVVLCYA